MILRLLLLCLAAPLLGAEPPSDESAWSAASRDFDLNQPAEALPVQAPAGGVPDLTGPRPVPVSEPELPLSMRQGDNWLEHIVADFPGMDHIHGQHDDGFIIRLYRALISVPGTLAIAIPRAAAWGFNLVRDGGKGGDDAGAALGAAVGFLIGLLGGLGVGAVEFFRNLGLSASSLWRSLKRLLSGE
ncbi:MAG: hypothetical protein HY549_04360 [Elusimicrobia bacterium]|nr:hypothetical protein [Elusimicrobiota bacterium]